MKNVVFADESYKIMGACFEDYRDRGCGFLEAVFQECLELEFEDQSISFLAQPHLALSYKGRSLKQTYSPDFICFDKTILEIKAVKEITDEQRAQVHNYLAATGMKLGLLVNFGHDPKLKSERIVL
jgi:GxxExxY protein